MLTVAQMDDAIGMLDRVGRTSWRSCLDPWSDDESRVVQDIQGALGAFDRAAIKPDPAIVMVDGQVWNFLRDRMSRAELVAQLVAGPLLISDAIDILGRIARARDS